SAPATQASVDSIERAVAESLAKLAPPDTAPVVLAAIPLDSSGTVHALGLGDTTTYGTGPSPFRIAPVAEFGFVRVVINGGSAPAIIDGRSFDFTPYVARVDVGTHYVSVRGAGDMFLPSQVKVEVTPRDTVLAVFAVPGWRPVAPAPAPAADSAAAPIPAPPASAADSVPRP
ncbi:MAG TPA: hypothetical protein VNA89_16675, partial [Gemmatimonadaceae bacterium]|nr:hypothetical protein [Gemmatimonadaceae bacterium]